MMGSRIAVVLWSFLLSAGGLSCGSSTATILERVDGATPPSSNIRMDVFLLRAVSSCAVGPPCASSNPDACFFLTDAAGGRISFDLDAVRFVPPGDPATTSGTAQVRCFRLTIDDAAAASVRDVTATLRTRVFQATGGDINVDLRLHEVPALEAGFSALAVGLFLQPPALEAVGLPLVNRETDIVYAITGFRDPDAGLTPKMEVCGGTNSLRQAVLGGSAYTWLALSESCSEVGTFLSTFVLQLYYGLRDVMAADDLYRSGGYPACGQASANPTDWFPSNDDCTTDPDAPSCGAASCPDREAFHQHILTTHWRRGQPFNGNHCSNGTMDRDETGIDTGGVCDEISR
jgi:hypothetical protein